MKLLLSPCYSHSLCLCLNLFLPVSFSFSLPEGGSIRRQRWLSVVVKRHFNLATLPRVRANYHFKRLRVPRSLPVGSAQYALSLSLTPLLSNADEGPSPLEHACSSILNKTLSERIGSTLIILHEQRNVFNPCEVECVRSFLKTGREQLEKCYNCSLEVVTEGM